MLMCPLFRKTSDRLFCRLFLVVSEQWPAFVRAKDRDRLHREGQSELMIRSTFYLLALLLAVAPCGGATGQIIFSNSKLPAVGAPSCLWLGARGEQLLERHINALAVSEAKVENAPSGRPYILSGQLKCSN